MDSNNTRPDLSNEINHRRITDQAFHILVFFYSILILFGAAGNSLVVLVVARKPTMRTARNMFILNLAISDLLLCLVTMPLTLIEIQAKYWPFGTDVVLCKLIETLRAVSIFVSTISITAIALDRYQVIVYPTRDNLQKMGAVGILAGIWLLSILLSSPMFFVKTLEVKTSKQLQLLGIPYLAFCIEDWRGLTNGRAYYSGFSLFVQYLLPIFIVSAAYMRIYFKLKSRMPLGGRPKSVNTSNVNNNRNKNEISGAETSLTIAPVSQMTEPSNRNKERDRRMKRTNYLLISIAAIFGISWLPLNVFNLIAELDILNLDYSTFFVLYAVCHMMGMSSACSNPLLYGWLNDNFRKEFNEILCVCSRSEYYGNHSTIRGNQNGNRSKRFTDNNSKVGLSVGDSNIRFESGVTENGLQTELTVLVR